MPLPPVKRILAAWSSIAALASPTIRLAALSMVIERVLGVLQTEVMEPLLLARVKRPLLPVAGVLLKLTKEQAGSTVPLKERVPWSAWLGSAHRQAQPVKAPTISFLFTIGGSRR